jgi:V/A-type H+-transporting ATPase subunit A
MLADSTSRWAEALREISGRLGEMPAEEGYPPSLASRLAAFYERAGRVTTLSGSEGSVTLVSAISPPGGDLTEPVTRHTQSYTRSFWTLSKELAAARFFPAISIRSSWSDVPQVVEEWWEREGGRGWTDLRRAALALLAEAARLEATARLMGTESLPEPQKFVLGAAAILEDGFLQQNAQDPNEARVAPRRQFELLELTMRFYRRGAAAVSRGATARSVLDQPVAGELRSARQSTGPLEALGREIDEALP